MAEKTLKKPAGATETATATPGVPMLQYRNLAIMGVALAIIWALAIASRSMAAVGVMAVLTLTLAGGGVYLWRLTVRQRKIMDLMQSASQSPAARRAAIAELSGKDGKEADALKVLARAQLEAQDDPDKALETLESLDIKKVPLLMQDEVRVARAQLYLVNNRVREALTLANEIQVSRAQQPESRGMMAATVAEAWARSGKHTEAADLLGTVSPDDGAYAKVRAPLLFARVFTNFAATRRELVRRDLQTLCTDDPNLLGRFLSPKFKVHPELTKMAREVAMRSPEVRKMAGRQNRAQLRAQGRRR